MKMNKRGGIGDFLAMMIAIIAIIFILGGFIILSGIFTKFMEKPAGAISYGKSGTEGDFFVYMDNNYVDLRRSVFDSEREGGLEVGYG